MSSMASLVPFPNLNQHSATKVYEDKLTRAITASNSKKQIDTLNVQPGINTTAMNNHAKILGVTCLPEETVRGSLSQLGLLNYT